MSSFCLLVIISYQYILNSVGKRGQPWHTRLLILSSFDSLELNFINILFCVYVSTVVFNNVSGIFIILKYKIKSVFVYYQMLFYNLCTTSVFPHCIPFVFQLII